MNFGAEKKRNGNEKKNAIEEKQTCVWIVVESEDAAPFEFLMGKKNNVPLFDQVKPK